MGRHGAGTPTKRRPRLSVPLIVIGALVLAAIGLGIWFVSLRSVTDPIDAKPVDAYAVVVSSPSCTSNDGTTVIDLSLNPVVRSSLSACGRRVGERLAVQYRDGHPDQVRLAGTTIAKKNPLGLWLPIAILAAGLLAVIATVTLLIERKQSRHTGAGARVTVAQLRAGADPPAVSPVPSAVVASAPTSLDRPAPAGPEVRAESEPAAPATATADNPDVTSRIAIPGFPGAVEHPFRPSEFDVDEDLFTHRGPEAPDR